MRIILYRHGERIGDRLTRLGKKHVKLSSKQLSEFNIKHVFCSPANRCLETEKIMRKQLRLPPCEIRDELNERWQLNHAPETSEEKLWWDNYMNYDFPHSPVGENCREFIDRNYKLFKEIVKNANDKDDILIIAHTATAYALNSFVSNKKKGQIDWFKMGNANYIAVEIN